MDTSCLHVLAVVNNTVKNMVYAYLFETTFNSFGYVYTEVKLLDHTVILILKNFFEPCCFPQWLLFYIHIRSMLFICLAVSKFCDLMDCSTPGFPVLHNRLEFAQTHVYWVGYDIQPSYPLSPSSPHVLNLSQHQGLFQWVYSLHHVAKVLELHLHHQSFIWILRVDLF